MKIRGNVISDLSFPSAPPAKKRLALVVNTIAPYRLPIYAELATAFDTLILHGGNEANRSWQIRVPEPLREHKVWTFQVRLKKRLGATNHFDTRYFHVNLGLLWDLPKFRPDIIISNEMGLRTIFSILYARLTGTDHWVWWGGTLHSERHISGPKKVLRRWIARWISRWISYGATSTEYLASIGVSPGNVLQIQNCVPHEIFLAPQPGSSDVLPEVPSPMLLAVGQLIARKGLVNLLESCGRLARQGHQFSLVLVGNGPDRDRLMSLARAKGITHFHLLPNQPQAVLSQLYHRAQALVFPTFEDVWGLVVNEAIWSGVPVLCSEFAGCAPEIVPRENIFDPTDPASFDAGLLRAIRGQLRSSDPAKLLTCHQVSDMVIRSVSQGRPAVVTPLLPPSAPAGPGAQEAPNV